MADLGATLLLAGWFHKAHIKPQSCYRTRLLLTHRRNLKADFLDLEDPCAIRSRRSASTWGKVGRGAFEQAVRAAAADDPLSAELMDAMLSARLRAVAEYRRLHGLVVKMVARSELCRRFIAIPGVGPVTALSFMTAINDTSRFRRLRDVAAYFGLTAQPCQPGSTIDVQGRIWKARDADVRRLLYEAASGQMTRFKGRDKVKIGGKAIAKRSGHRKACVAVARRLAVIMHAMWSDGTFYVGDSAVSQSDAARRAHIKDRRLLVAHR